MTLIDDPTYDFPVTLGPPKATGKIEDVGGIDPAPEWVIMTDRSRTKGIEGGELVLEFRRQTNHPNREIDVSLQIEFKNWSPLRPGADPNKHIDFGTPASKSDFEVALNYNDIFVLKKIHFASNEDTVTKRLKIKSDSLPEDVGGVQIKILETMTVTSPLPWNHRERDGFGVVADFLGGNEVTCYIVDGVTLYATENTNAELNDSDLGVGNPGINWNDPNQGALKDCFLIASLAATGPARTLGAMGSLRIVCVNAISSLC